MNLRLRLTRLKGHRAYVSALLRRAGELERRATAASAEEIRKIEAMRQLRGGDIGWLTAAKELAEAGMEHLSAIRELLREMKEDTASMPQATGSQRRQVRDELEYGLGTLESAVVMAEKGFDPRKSGNVVGRQSLASRPVASAWEMPRPCLGF